MPDFRTLPDALSDAASSEQGYVFLVGGDEVRRSYADIRQAALGVAQSLSESGLEPGDLVAIVINDAEQFLTAFLGVSVAGIVVSMRWLRPGWGRVCRAGGGKSPRS